MLDGVWAFGDALVCTLLVIDYWFFRELTRFLWRGERND